MMGECLLGIDNSPIAKFAPGPMFTLELDFGSKPPTVPSEVPSPTIFHSLILPETYPEDESQPILGYIT